MRYFIIISRALYAINSLCACVVDHMLVLLLFVILYLLLGDPNIFFKNDGCWIIFLPEACHQLLFPPVTCFFKFSRVWLERSTLKFRAIPFLLGW